MKFALSILLVLCLSVMSRAVEPIFLNVTQRTNGEVAITVTGGTSNTQYKIWTSNDYTVDSTNAYYWRRAYSSTYHTNVGDILVFSPSSTTNQASGKPQRFFYVNGELPD